MRATREAKSKTSGSVGNAASPWCNTPKADMGSMRSVEVPRRISLRGRNRLASARKSAALAWAVAAAIVS